MVHLFNIITYVKFSMKNAAYKELKLSFSS